jgi:peptidoglycan/LPS O-acetylase OafA/YrhL
VVFLPALLLTFVLDTLGRSFFAEYGLYSLKFIDGHFSLWLVIPELANFQEIFSPYYGTNAALWSLAMEFWYYLTFPAIMLLFAQRHSIITRISGFMLGCLIIAIMTAYNSMFLFYYVLWILGALARLAPRSVIDRPWVALALLIAAVVPTRLLVRGPVLEALPELQQFADLINAVLYANLLVSVRFGPSEGWRPLRSDIHRKLADFSFSMYSIHMPISVFAVSAINQMAGQDWTPSKNGTLDHWFVLCALLAATTAATYGFSRLTEAHTKEARRFLRRLVLRAPVMGAETSSAARPNS